MVPHNLNFWGLWKFVFSYWFIKGNRWFLKGVFHAQQVTSLTKYAFCKTTMTICILFSWLSNAKIRNADYPCLTQVSTHIPYTFIHFPMKGEKDAGSSAGAAAASGKTNNPLYTADVYLPCLPQGILPWTCCQMSQPPSWENAVDMQDDVLLINLPLSH